MIRLLAGLGNPGAEYEATRHNAGFWFVDEAARALKVSLAPDRGYHGLVARANTAHGPVWLLQPMTYMNLSGQSVAALARFFKIAPEEILVVHDELDLPPGQVKLKRGGSHAGHNGLKDIHARLGSADYWRLRLGIGHPGVKAEVVNHVLRKPPLAERQAIDEAIASSLKALDLLLAGEMDKATVRLHAKPPRPKPPRPPALPGMEPGRVAGALPGAGAGAGAAGGSTSAPVSASSSVVASPALTPAPSPAFDPSSGTAPVAASPARRPPSKE